MTRLLLFLVALGVPSFAYAASADLAVSADDVSFSDELVAGETVRLYARVTNVGAVDVSGYVSFFQGAVPVGDSQVISVRSGGVPEEIYVDFAVPSGSFNIRAEIRGTDPEDENPDNDVAVTPLLTPLMDEDRDGVSDKTDNCPQDSNKNQRDTDKDGAGDACDEDDDDDTLSDDVETELGTKPDQKDSDGDGSLDPNDAYPTDPSRFVTEPVMPPAAPPIRVTKTLPPDPVAEPVVPTRPASSDAAASSVAAADSTAAGLAESTPNPEQKPEFEPADSVLSPMAAFTYARTSWNTFVFGAIAPEASASRFQWDFGDGVTSSRAQVEHTYASGGSFSVTFRTTDDSGLASQDTVVVHVPFWTIHNRAVDFLLAILGLLLLSGIILLARLYRAPVRPAAGPEGPSPDVQPRTVSDEDLDADAASAKPTRVHVRNVD